MMKAMLLETSADSAAQLKLYLDEIDISLVEWIPKGTGWIALYQKHRPHFLVVDYVLAQKNGLHCLKRAVEMDEGCLCVFTHAHLGLVANDLEMKAVAQGAAAVLQKPFVKSRVQRVFSRLKEQAVNRRMMGSGLPTKLVT